MSVLDSKRFTALGQEWIARFDFNATCAIEDETGKGFYEVVAPYLVQLDEAERKDPGKVLEVLKGIRNSTTRMVLFHALSYEHEVTPELVGDIIQDIGRLEAQKIVTWAIVRGLDGDTAKLEGGEGNAKAPTAPTPNRRARKAAAKRG